MDFPLAVGARRPGRRFYDVQLQFHRGCHKSSGIGPDYRSVPRLDYFGPFRQAVRAEPQVQQAPARRNPRIVDRGTRSRQHATSGKRRKLLLGPQTGTRRGMVQHPGTGAAQERISPMGK